MKILYFIVLMGAILLMPNANAVSWWDMDPLVIREKINQRIMATEAPTPAVGSVSEQTLTREKRTTPLRIYRPASEKQVPILLLIHGGAWIAGNLDTHDNLARYLCAETPSVVVSVGYTNAPEGKFPLALEQCYDVLAWIAENGPSLSGGHTKIAVIGDSSGGNMATALCLMARDRSGPKIDLQVLINPAPDLTCKGTILRQNDDLDTLRYQAFHYLSNPQDAQNPYASPLAAKNLSDLPPALVILAEKDELRASGQNYADRLRSANVPTEVYCQIGIGHLAGEGARASFRARESLDVAVDRVRQMFVK